MRAASPRRLASIWNRSEAELTYAIVIEEAGDNYSAYLPNLPGCVATGVTADKAKTEIAAAIVFDLVGLDEDGLPVPTPQAQVAMVEA